MFPLCYSQSSWVIRPVHAHNLAFVICDDDGIGSRFQGHPLQFQLLVSAFASRDVPSDYRRSCDGCRLHPLSARWTVTHRVRSLPW